MDNNVNATELIEALNWVRDEKDSTIQIVDYMARNKPKTFIQIINSLKDNMQNYVVVLVVNQEMFSQPECISYKIPIIKLIRRLTGMGLAEAKTACEKGNLVLTGPTMRVDAQRKLNLINADWYAHETKRFPQEFFAIEKRS